jgi:hypothetical protein
MATQSTDQNGAAPGSAFAAAMRTIKREHLPQTPPQCNACAVLCQQSGNKGKNLGFDLSKQRSQQNSKAKIVVNLRTG